MLGIFVAALILLGALLFAVGFLVGREMGPASDGAAAPALLQGVQQHVPGAAKAGGAIAPAVPVQPGAPAAPALPAVPGLPPLPGGPKLPDVPIPAVPAAPAPKPVSDAGDGDKKAIASAVAKSLDDPQPTRRPASESRAAAADMDGRSADGLSKGARSGATGMASPGSRQVPEDARSQPSRGYVVYAGAFESAAGAEVLVHDLKRHNLTAQISSMEKPGSKTLSTVWLGVYEDRTSARAALAAVRDAGVANPYIKAVP